MSKIIRTQALEMTRYCREHNVLYASSATYPNTAKAAAKKNTRTPNGVLIHMPRVTLAERERGYVLWFGEPLTEIVEALAFFKMTTRVRELFVLRCQNKISGAALAVEDEVTEENLNEQQT